MVGARGMGAPMTSQAQGTAPAPSSSTPEYSEPVSADATTSAAEAIPPRVVVNAEAQTPLNPWQRYCLLLETNPFLTKAATSLVGFALGDVLAQRLEGSAVIDAGRVLHLGLYGFLLDGPVGHLWYKWLDGTCDKTFENPKGTASVAVKTTADQIIWAPIMTCVFFAFLKFMEGHPELMLPTIQEKVLPTVAANYVIWPAAHIVSFKYVPSHQRILYNNGIAIFWNCYLSLVASGGGMDVAALGGVDPSSASNLAGLHDIAMRVQSTLPYNGYWIQDLLDLQNPIGTSAAQLAAKGASSPFIDSVLNMQNMTLGR